MTARTHITAEDLRGACRREINLFNSMFPGGVEINAHNIELYIAAGFKCWWFSPLMPVSAWVEYEKATIPAWNDYINEEAVIEAEKERAIDAARAEFEKATAPALVAALTYDSAEKTA